MLYDEVDLGTIDIPRRTMENLHLDRDASVAGDTEKNGQHEYHQHHLLPSKPASSGDDYAGIQSHIYLSDTFTELARQHAAKLQHPKPFNLTCTPAAGIATGSSNPSRSTTPHILGGTPIVGRGVTFDERSWNSDQQAHTPYMGAGAPVPASSVALTAAGQLATMGIGYGPGINPNIAQLNCDGHGGITAANNPPIVNTGNNGPMFIQPGDWVCSSCGFVNWRRRRVCMRCYPFADQTEVSSQIAQGALLAAKLAAGIDLAPEAVTALTNTRKNATSIGNGGVNTSTNTSSASLPSTPAVASFAPHASLLAHNSAGHEGGPSPAHVRVAAPSQLTRQCSDSLGLASYGQKSMLAGQSKVDAMSRTISVESLWRPDSIWSTSSIPSSMKKSATMGPLGRTPSLLTHGALAAATTTPAPETLANELDEIVLPTSRNLRRANTLHDNFLIRSSSSSAADDQHPAKISHSDQNYAFPAIEPPSKQAKS